ncbi:hypothetical protein QOZ80_7AG0582870 [Eleusine coracana subsp. coracana]|nr:hypothetical protein QOZ80_7AG0582870 [Eleusine coracana subsp. coracana]
MGRVAVASAVLLLLCWSSCCLVAAGGGLKLGYYGGSCPRAEEVVKEQVTQLYHKHGNTAVSWLRAIFHDCMVKSCDASLLLLSSSSSSASTSTSTSTRGGGGFGGESEQASGRSFGMRNFKYMDVIKAAVEKECPGVVSCADILALAARDGVTMLGGPRVSMRTGRRDSKQSFFSDVERFIPNHNDSVSVVLSRFAAMGVEAEAAVALLGAHSVGRVHCFNLVHRLYPTVDASMDQAYGASYLRGRCPTKDAKEDTRDVVYARNDRETPMVLDNMYYKHLLARKGLLLVDQQLADDPRTRPFVLKMAADNDYFHQRFAAALLTMSENNPLTGEQGEVRRDCRFINSS